MMKEEMTMSREDNYKPLEFEAIRIGICSPDKILRESHGEVKKPETINYRTLKPEKDGLYCERIFGPTKDWECHCGKYKKIRYKGVICDKCGVEVTKSSVRRSRIDNLFSCLLSLLLLILFTILSLSTSTSEVII